MLLIMIRYMHNWNIQFILIYMCNIFLLIGLIGLFVLGSGQLDGGGGDMWERLGQHSTQRFGNGFCRLRVWAGTPPRGGTLVSLHIMT